MIQGVLGDLTPEEETTKVQGAAEKEGSSSISGRGWERC